MRNSQRGVTLVEMLFVIIVLGFIPGWIGNVVQLAVADWSTITGLLVLKAIGVFVAPLGAVLGWVGFF